MPTMSTLDVQKALTVASRQDPAHIDPPGALDGRWGPHTQSSFDSWVAAQSADLISTAGLMTVPPRGATQITVVTPIYAVLYSLAQIYNMQGGSPVQQIPAPAQRAAAAATAAQAAQATAMTATTPAQRAAASAAISQGAGMNALLPVRPGPMLLQQPSTGPLGIDWWIWGLLGLGVVGTAGGLYWYYQYGRKHRRR